MIFLIEYNRSEGRIVTLQDFKEEERLEAENARLEMELELNRRKCVGHEVVLLEAASREALHRTHVRYFKSLREILEDCRNRLQLLDMPSLEVPEG